jgi:MraZ protein
VVESGNDWMFTGEYHHNLDAKGRMIIPAKFREGQSDTFWVTRSLDGCLSMYTPDGWQELVNKLDSLQFTSTKARMMKRFIIGSSVQCDLDKQGRILIPQVLRKTAGLDKDVTLVGVGDHVEIWSSESWDAYNNFDDPEALAAELEGLGI